MKKIILLICIVAIIFVLCGCSSAVKKYDSNREGGRFVTIEKYIETGLSFDNDYHVVLDRKTNVLYLWMKSGLTPIYNADGSLAKYKEN